MTSSWKMFLKAWSQRKNSIRRLKIQGNVSATQYWVPGVEVVDEIVGQEERIMTYDEAEATRENF